MSHNCKAVWICPRSHCWMLPHNLRSRDIFVVHGTHNGANNNKDHTNNNNDDDNIIGVAVIGTLVCCLITGTMAGLVCFLTRNIVSTVFACSPGTGGRRANNEEDQTDRLMNLVIRNVESWFGIGSLVVAIPSWMSSFLVLGRQQDVAQNNVWFIGTVLFLSMTVVAANVMFATCSNSGDSLDDIFATPTSIETAAVVPRVAPDPPASIEIGPSTMTLSV